MKPPLFVRDLTAAERDALRHGLRSADAFTLRRSQILLARAAGQRPAQIAAALGCATQTVRDAIRAFHADPAGCLAPRSKAPKTTHPAWPRGRDEDLKALLHQSPRALGQRTSLWGLGLVAAVCHEKGWADRVLSLESIRRILKRLGVGWRRAKHWLTSPDPGYAAKKSPGRPDRRGRDAPRPGARVPGRVLVDPAGPARPVRLGGRRPAEAEAEPGAGQGGRAAGGGLLRGAEGGHRGDDAPVRGRAAGQPGDRGLPGLGVPDPGRGGEAGARAGLGQRRVARE